MKNPHAPAQPAPRADPLSLVHQDSITERASTPTPAASAQPEQGTPARLAERVCDTRVAERTAHIGSWSIDLPGNQLTHSDEFAAILGVTAGTPITLKDMTAKYTPEWSASINTLIQNCRLTGTPFDEEMQIQTAPKARKWVRTVGEAVYDQNGESGQIIRIQGALQDISAQKKAQDETLRLAMRLTTTLASITEAFVTLDRQCCFTYLNQESERLLQGTTRELLGKEVWQNFDDGVGQRLKQKLEKSLARNRRVEHEDFYPTLGKWLEVRAYPFAEGLAVYFNDVTKRRKSQEQLMLLETSISRLNDIVVIAEALPASGREARIVFVNDAFEHHTGYGRDEVLGQTPSLLLGPTPQTRGIAQPGGRAATERTGPQRADDLQEGWHLVLGRAGDRVRARAIRGVDALGGRGTQRHSTQGGRGQDSPSGLPRSIDRVAQPATAAGPAATCVDPERPVSAPRCADVH